MKKRINKIIAGILLTATLMLANGFCIHGLSVKHEFNVASPTVSYRGYQAVENTTIKAVCLNIDDKRELICVSSEYGVKQANALVKHAVAAHTEHDQASALPCCEDDGHPTIAAVSRFWEFGKYIPLIILPIEKITSLSFIVSFYKAPRISPPELLAVKKTVLRI